MMLSVSCFILSSTPSHLSQQLACVSLSAMSGGLVQRWVTFLFWQGHTVTYIFLLLDFCAGKFGWYGPWEGESRSDYNKLSVPYMNWTKKCKPTFCIFIVACTVSQSVYCIILYILHNVTEITENYHHLSRTASWAPPGTCQWGC